MWNDIKKCTKIFNKANVETNAYVRGISEMYGVDLQKHKDNLMAELEEENKEANEGDKNGINLEENRKWKS